MISRFNLDQKRLSFYENPEIFHKEFADIVSSNNENELMYSAEEPIVVLNKDKTLKLTLIKEDKQLDYIYFLIIAFQFYPKKKSKFIKRLRMFQALLFIN